MRDLKYLFAYSIPLSAFFSIYLLEEYSFITTAYSFIIIPFVELFTPEKETNLNLEQKSSKLKNKIFDLMLYVNIPIVYGLLIYAFYVISTNQLSILEYIGVTMALGIVVVTNGINVAHELGHRSGYERYLSKILLLPTLYQHFYLEHNFGHHLNVATPKDPATSKYNQNVYHFWFTSCYKQYINAWHIQMKLLKQHNRNFISLHNDMVLYHLFQIAYLSATFYFFNTTVLIVATLSGILSFLFLETINYIEHYGLMRSTTKNGRYERVSNIHSWNSNHTLGRIILYELTRHSDHHARSNKKYQILDHHDDSPQLPYGYPASILLALVPPLWFKIMNKRIPESMLPN